MCSVKGFSTVEATARSLLREDKIGKQHEEDADDEADVEVDRRPALHALPSQARLLEATLRAATCRSCQSSSSSKCGSEQRARSDSEGSDRVVYPNGGTVLLVGYLFFPKNEARFFFWPNSALFDGVALT